MDKKVIKGILIVALLTGLYFLNIQQQKEYENIEIQFLNVENVKSTLISNKVYNVSGIPNISLAT